MALIIKKKAEKSEVPVPVKKPTYASILKHPLDKRF